VRILWLKTELLHPVDKGGKIRTYNMLRELKRDHEITYLTLDEGSDESARSLADEYCHELVVVPHKTRPKFSAGFYAELAGNLISPLPYFLTKYESSKMRAAISEQLARRTFDVIISDFLQPTVNLPDNLSSTALVLFQHNVEAMIWKRHYEVQTNSLKKIYLKNQWLKTLNYERTVSHRFDLVIAVSKEDADTFRRDYGIENVIDVPTGVDIDYFRPRRDGQVRPNSLVFTGSMDWLPNEDGVQYFTKEILPLVRKRIPDVVVTIVGRNPYPSLLELSERDKGVVVTGRVDDVRPYIDNASVFVVPLRIGGGTRLKIYEAMAMERAVVSTTIGAEGLPLTPGKEILIADTPEEFAESVIGLLGNREMAQELGRNAATRVRHEFGWDHVAKTFATACENVLRG
jgi:sugar transferase (PEP-CTERM/EpsH1 system associated)